MNEITKIKELKGEIKIGTDDLREVMMCFMSKLSVTDLLYALIQLEGEYEQRRYGRGWAAA